MGCSFDQMSWMSQARMGFGFGQWREDSLEKNFLHIRPFTRPSVKQPPNLASITNYQRVQSLVGYLHRYTLVAGKQLFV